MQAQMIDIYSAGHIADCRAWISVREAWKPEGFNIISSWLDLTHQGLPETDAFAKAFWQVDIAQATGARCLVAWASDEAKPLRGALVEIGAALAVRNPVILVGNHHQFQGSWALHPLITRVHDFRIAEQWLKIMATGFWGRGLCL